MVVQYLENYIKRNLFREKFNYFHSSWCYNVFILKNFFFIIKTDFKR